jgi:hypothetical protein
MGKERREISFLRCLERSSQVAPEMVVKWVVPACAGPSARARIVPEGGPYMKALIRTADSKGRVALPGFAAQALAKPPMPNSAARRAVKRFRKSYGLYKRSGTIPNQRA